MDAETLYHGYSAIQLKASPIGVDRDRGMLLGYVVAQEGEFKSTGRGRFNLDSLKEIVRLGNASPKGLKSRFGHPGASDDGLGKLLGRGIDYRLDKTQSNKNCVRADLLFNKASRISPHGNLAEYVMTVCETDSDAISSSLVLKTKKTFDLDREGKKTDTPPLWMPTELYASDIVDTGDAVDGLLSAEELPNGYLFKASQMLDLLFAESTREEIEARIGNFLTKYLDIRFGPKFDYAAYRKQLIERSKS